MPRPPQTPRPALADLSPGSRNRIIGARAHGVPFSAIATQENCSRSAAFSTVKNAPKRPGAFTQLKGHPARKLSPRDERAIFRAIERNPKITASKLRIEVVPHVSQKTIYRFLQQSGIQKWRCRKRPLLTDERAARRLQWALAHDNKPLAYWQRWRWSDECSIERGKGGKWDFVYRKRGK